MSEALIPETLIPLERWLGGLRKDLARI